MLRIGLKLQDTQLRAALSGSFVSLLTKLAAAAAGVALTILIARRFGAAGSGTWVLANTILMICGYVALCGLDYGSTRAVAVYRTAERWGAVKAWTLTGFSIILLAGAVITAVAWFSAAWIATALSEGVLFVRVMHCLALAVIPYALLRFMAGSFRGVRRFAVADVLESGFVSAALAIALLLFDIRSLEDTGVAYVAVATVGALCGLALWRHAFRDKTEPTEALMPGEALGRSLPLAGAVLATLAGPWVVTLFLAKFAPTAEVGIYRVALQFALLLGFLLNAAETGLSPQIAALHSQQKLKELSNAAKRMTLILIVAGGAPALVLLFFTDLALSIMGHEFEQGATAMRILIAAQIFNLATGPVGSFMAMTGLERLSFWNAVAGGVLVLVLSALLIPHYGIEGAALASGAATITRNLVATIIVWRRHGLFLPLGVVRDA